MLDKERRHEAKAMAIALKRELNDAQRQTLSELEPFGWELKYIRRPIFKPIIPIVLDGDRKKFAVIETDGTLNENPGFTLRD